MVMAMVIFAVTVAAAEQPVGSINTLEGKVIISRSGARKVAVIGQPIYQRDTVYTEADSRVGIILRDDTTLSLGPESALELQSYRFQPSERQFSLVVRMLKGTFAYLSGVMGKLAPEAIRLETPDSVIGIRGTHLLVEVKGS